MTGPRSVRRWDLFRPLDMLASLWSSAAAAPTSVGTGTAYRTLFTTVRRLMVSRRLIVKLDDGNLTLTITKFDSRLDVRGLSVGQLSDVRLAARDIYWNATRFDRATAVIHNVHLRPAAPPVLVGAPIELTLDVPAPAIDDLFRWAAPRLAAEIGSDSVARVRLAARPVWGHLEVAARIDGSTLWLQPRGVTVGRIRMPLPRRAPAYPVRLPELPHGLVLTGISFAPGQVRLTGTVCEWRLAVPRKRLEDILDQLSMVGLPLNLTRITLGR